MLGVRFLFLALSSPARYLIPVPFVCFSPICRSCNDWAAKMQCLALQHLHVRKKTAWKTCKLRISLYFEICCWSVVYRGGGQGQIPPGSMLAGGLSCHPFLHNPQLHSAAAFFLGHSEGRHFPLLKVKEGDCLRNGAVMLELIAVTWWCFHNYFWSRSQLILPCARLGGQPGSPLCWWPCTGTRTCGLSSYQGHLVLP